MKFVTSILLNFLFLLTEIQSQFLLNSISPVVDQRWEAYAIAVAEQLKATEDFYDTRGLFHNILAALKSSHFPTAVAKNISQQCIEDSQFYVHNLYVNRSLWALQMQESSGQLPPGLFGALNFQADGLFDECKAVRAPVFNGQYCKVFFKNAPVNQTDIISRISPDEEYDERSNFITIFQILGQLLGSDRVEPKMSGVGPYTFVLPSISFCLPSSCSADDLGKAVAQLVGSYVIANNSIVTLTDEQYCFKDTDEKRILDGPDVTVIVVLSLLGVLIVLATIHEAYRTYCGINFDSNADGKLLSALHCFSTLSNGRKILSMKVSASSAKDNFGCIHGIRFFSTCWVVLGHSWSLMPYKTMNPKAVLTDAYGLGMQTIVNGSVSVDTFFLMSGLLVSFLLLRELDRTKGKFNVGLFYLHRYLRLTPVYAVILGFVATLMVYLGTGPNWYNVNLLSNACRISWWRQFLYINNLFPLDPYHQCIGQAWYLAVDMQLFLLSPLFIYPLWRWRKAGLAFLAFVATISYATIFTAYAIYDLPPAYIPTRLDNLGTASDFFDHYYLKPWTRAPPYLLGIWAGWYLHITKESPCRLSKTLTAMGWTISAAVGLAVVYGLAPYVDQSEMPDISSTVSIIYGPLHRTAWACVIAWIIFACSRGYGGFVNRILSWKGFLPLGRLTYCVYLIHYDFLNVFYSAIRKQFYYNMLQQFTTSFGLIFISFGLAFVAAVTVEASFLNLEKLVFASKIKSKSSEEADHPVEKTKC